MWEPLVLESYLALVNRYTGLWATLVRNALMSSTHFQLMSSTDFRVGGPGGVDYTNKSVLAYHSYCPNDASGSPRPMLFCRAIIEKVHRF